MCNAHNHRSGCACGFGGDGHLGKRGDLSSLPSPLYRGIPLITRHLESYTNPNAQCPVCGAAVYFYASPSGGRVFFDELGPPWPKHPCTDNSSIPSCLPSNVNWAPGTTKSELLEVPKDHSWKRNGWKPFYVVEVRRGTYKGVMEIIGSYTPSIFTLNRIPLRDDLNKHEVRRMVYKGMISIFTLNSNPLRANLNEHLAFLKKSGDSYDLSVLSVAGEGITVKAFTNEEAARRIYSRATVAPRI